MKKSGYTDYNSIFANSILLSYRAVTANGNYFDPSDLSDIFFGISIEDSAINEGVTCITNGIAVIECDETVSQSDILSCSIDGKAIRYRGLGSYIGIALESGNANDLIPMLIRFGIEKASSVLDAINGLRMSYVDTHTIRISSGSCSDSSNTANIISDSDIDIDFNISGEGGLDTGTVSNNTWYFSYIIQKPDGSVNGLLSLSNISPTLPSGYDKYRRLGSIRMSGVFSIVPFYQIGKYNFRKYNWDLYSQFTNVLDGGTNTSYTSVDISSIVPNTAQSCIIKHYIKNELSDEPYGNVNSPRATNYDTGQSETMIGRGCDSLSELILDGLQTIEYRASDCELSIFIIGYTEEL